MKNKREHRVPIVTPMYELLCSLGERSGLVFKSRRLGQISDMTLLALMKRMHASDEKGFVDFTSRLPSVPHGLRSPSEIGLPKQDNPVRQRSFNWHTNLAPQLSMLTTGRTFSTRERN